MAAFAPARCRRLSGLLGRITRQILAWRRQAKLFLIESGFSNEELEKARPFEPPMPKQFRVEGDHDDWIGIERARAAKLRRALFEKMVRMFVDGSFRCGAIVQFFFLTAIGDAVVFDAGKFARPPRDRADVFEWKIEAGIAVKFPIRRVTGISFVRAPDLPARIPVAREGGRSGRRVTRRIDRATRLRICKKEAVSVENEPANVRFLQNRFQPRREGALRQPNPTRIGPEKIDIDIATDQDLGARGLGRLLLQQRKQTVRRSRGDDFERTGLTQRSKRTQ